MPRGVYLWVCDRLYHEAAFAYDWVAALVSGGRWRDWGERASLGLRGRVVEVGPGPGHVLGSLRRRGVAAVGVELSAAMAGRSARRSPGAVARGSALALPIRDGAADAMLLTFPAQYALSPGFWAEAARVVRPGGRLRMLLEAGSSYGSGGSVRVRPPAGQWLVRRVRVPAGDVTLGMLVAVRRREPSNVTPAAPFAALSPSGRPHPVPLPEGEETREQRLGDHRAAVPGVLSADEQ